MEDYSQVIGKMVRIVTEGEVIVGEICNIYTDDNILLEIYGEKSLRYEGREWGGTRGILHVSSNEIKDIDFI